MLEVVIGVIIALLVCLSIFLDITRSKLMINNFEILARKLSDDAELLKENLDHLAGAIISMSELLDDADKVIEDISKVPTVGEMIQQALVGFVTQKVSNSIPAEIMNPMQQVIKSNDVDIQHGEKETNNKT
tara:strand:- start:196 stop:588 length:393 start_codon:yes stop_codon:yes gene_type:complete